MVTKDDTPDTTSSGVRTCARTVANSSAPSSEADNILPCQPGRGSARRRPVSRHDEASATSDERLPRDQGAKLPRWPSNLNPSSALGILARLPRSSARSESFSHDRWNQQCCATRDTRKRLFARRTSSGVPRSDLGSAAIDTPPPTRRQARAPHNGLQGQVGARTAICHTMSRVDRRPPITPQLQPSRQERTAAKDGPPGRPAA